MADQLPPALAGDERFAILCELLQEEFDDLDLSPMLVYLVDVVPPQVLPHLADQFHVMSLEGWHYARNEQEQRELIKRAIELHRYKGTPWAIEQALLTVLGVTAEVVEWFQYQGRPYRFQLHIERTGSVSRLDDLTFDSLFKLVREYKNARSRLERVTLSQKLRQPISLATATRLASTQRIGLTAAAPSLPVLSLHTGCTPHLAQHLVVRPFAAPDVQSLVRHRASILHHARITTIEAHYG